MNRFWSKVERRGLLECWPWRAHMTRPYECYGCGNPDTDTKYCERCEREMAEEEAERAEHEAECAAVLAAIPRCPDCGERVTWECPWEHAEPCPRFDPGPCECVCACGVSDAPCACEPCPSCEWWEKNIPRLEVEP